MRKVPLFLSKSMVYLLCCPTHSGNRKGVPQVAEIVTGLIVAVGANVIAHYICKWLDD